MNKKAYAKGYIKGLQLAKRAGVISELLNNLYNPVAAAGAPVGAIAALLTKTRTPTEQYKHDKGFSGTLADTFVPGSAAYNFFKRVGVKPDKDEEESKKNVTVNIQQQ